MTKTVTKAETHLLRLAEILGVDISHGWRTRLAKRLGVKKNTLQTWCSRGGITKNAIEAAERAGVRAHQWVNAVDEQYEESPENIGQSSNGRDNLLDRDAGSYGAPMLNAHRVQQTFGPDEQWYVEAVKEVLRSGEHGTIIALQSNIVQFKEQVQERAAARDRGVRERELLEQNRRLLEQNQELLERVAELERTGRSANSGRSTQARDPSLKNDSTESV